MNAGGDAVDREPTIGVVIPTYNCARLILTAIESVREQTWTRWRIVVVDDGSTDDTAEVLAPLVARGEITFLRFPNRGPSAARNSGILALDCPLIAFLDADDTLDPDALRAMALALEAVPHAAFAIADVLRVYQDRSELRTGCPPPGDSRTAILERNFVEGGGLFRRQALIDVGLFEESLRAVEDWDLYIRLILRGFEPTYVAGPLYRYVMRADSITRDVRSLVAAYEVVIRHHHGALARRGDRAARHLYAYHLWRIGREYFYKAGMRVKAAACLLEALRYDRSPQRLRRLPTPSAGGGRA
jgi:glycosyltransferase involved in cell wall biosynthesis